MQYAIDFTLQNLGTSHNDIQDTEAAELLGFKDFDDFQGKLYIFNFCTKLKYYVKRVVYILK